MKLQSSLKEGTVLMITPLVDILFLILIFFVINSGMTRENVLGLELPESEAGDTLSQREIRVSVKADRTLYINGDLVPLSSFSELLLEKTEAEPGSPVYLEGDRDMPYEYLIDIMTRMKLLGIEISLIVENNS